MSTRRSLRPRPIAHSLARLSSAGAIAAAIHFASAQTVWDGSVGDGLWTTAANWDTNVVPMPFDSVSFGTGPAGLVQLVGNQTVNAIAFTDNFTLGNFGTPNILTNTAGTVTVNTGKTATMNALLAGTNGLFVSGGGTLHLNNILQLFAGNVTIDGAGTTLITGYQSLTPQLAGTAAIANSPRTDAYPLGVSLVKTITMQSGGEWKIIGPGGNPDGNTKNVSFAGGALNLAAAYAQLLLDDAGQLTSSGDVILRGKGRVSITGGNSDYNLGNNLIVEGGVMELNRLQGASGTAGTRFSLLGTTSTVAVSGGMLLLNNGTQGRLDNPLTLSGTGSISWTGAEHILGNNAGGVDIPLTLDGGTLLIRDGFNPQTARLPRIRSLLAGNGTVEVVAATGNASNPRLVLERGDLATQHTFTGTFLVRENAVVEANPRQGAVGIGNALGKGNVDLEGWGATLDLRDTVSSVAVTNTLLDDTQGLSNYEEIDVTVRSTQLGNQPSLTLNRVTDNTALSAGNIFNLNTLTIGSQRLLVTGIPNVVTNVSTGNGYGVAFNGVSIRGDAIFDQVSTSGRSDGTPPTPQPSVSTPVIFLGPVTEDAAGRTLTKLQHANGFQGIGGTVIGGINADMIAGSAISVSNINVAHGPLILRGTGGLIGAGFGGAAPTVTINGGENSGTLRGNSIRGLLHLDGAGTSPGVAAGNNNNRIDDTATVRMFSNSILRLTSAQDIATTETIGTLQVNGAHALVDVLTTGVPPSPVALTLNALTLTNNSTVNFSGTNLGTAGVNSSRIVLPAATADGFLGVPFHVNNEWAKYDGTTVDGTGVKVGVTPFTGADYTQDNTEDLWAVGQHNKQTSAIGVTLTANRSVDTLNQQFGAGNQAINTSGFTLTIDKGGMITGANTSGIIGNAGVGALTAGSTGATTLYIHANNQLDIKVPITNNLGGGAVSVVKSGTSTIRLTHHLLGVGTGNQGGSVPPFTDPTWSSTMTGTWTINEGSLDVHRGQFLNGRPVILNGGTFTINTPVSTANANTIVPGWDNDVTVNGNAVVGQDDNGESADPGVGGNTMIKLGSLTINNGATLGVGSFNSMDVAFMEGVTFNGRAAINTGVNRSGGNGQAIFSGAVTGNGFELVNLGGAAASLILGGTVTDIAPNTFTDSVIVRGGTLRLNKANGVVALPDTAGAEDLVVNGGTLAWGPGHHGDLLTTNNVNTTNNGVANGLLLTTPAATLAAGQNQIADGATVTLLLGTVGESDRLQNERWARLIQKNGTLNVGLGTMQIDTMDVTGGAFGINNGGTLRAGAMNLLPGAYSPNITTGALANPAQQTTLEIGAGGLNMTGQNLIIGGGSSASLIGAGARLLLGGNVSAVDDPLNANSYFQGIWVQVGNTFRELGNSKTDLMGGDRTFTIDDDVQFFVSTRLSNGGLIKSGGGTLHLQPYEASDFAGTVTVNNGILTARGNGSFGTSAGGVVINNGGTVKLESGWSYGDNFSVSGPGAIVPGSNSNVREAGALVSEMGYNRILPTATFTLIGGATVASSTVNNPSALPVGGAFPFSRSFFSIESAGGIVGSGLLTLSGAGDGIVLGGVNVTGAGNGLAKQGLGRWTVAGPSLYDGPTSILAGPLRITNNAALGGVSTGTTVSGGGALELGGGLTIAEPLTLFGAGAGEQSGAVVSVAGMNTLNGTVTVGYNATLRANGTLNLGNTTSVVALGDQSLTLTGGGTGTVQGSVALNEGALIKNGAGRWTLQGAVSYENIAQLNGGLLVLDYRANNTSKLNTSALTNFSGGSLSLIGSDTAATTQASGGFNLLGGHAEISVASGAGQSATLGISSLSRTAGGGTINFTLPAAGAITTGAAVANGILGGFATVGGQNWATLSGFNIAAFTGYTPLGFDAASDTNNSLLSVPGTLRGNVTTNSLKLTGGAGLNLDFNALTLSSGGLLYTGAGDASIAGTGTLSGTDDLIVHVASGTLDIGASVIGGGSGALVKAGAGTLFLSGANSFNGPINIGQGTLAIIGPGGTAHPAALGANGSGRDINLNGGTFRVNGDFDPGINSMEVVVGESGGTIRMEFGGAIILNDAGQLSGPGDLTLTGGGRYTIGQASTGFPAFTGKITVESGVLSLVNQTAIGGRAEQTITLRPGAVLFDSVAGAVGVLGLPNNIVLEGNNQLFVGGGNRIYNGDIQLNGTNTIALFDRDNPGQDRTVGMGGRLSGNNITLNILGGTGLGVPLFLQSGNNDFTGTINLGPNAVLEARMPGSLGVKTGDITINMALNSRLLLRHWQNADFLANVVVNESAEINSDRLGNYGAGAQQLMGINNLTVGANAQLLSLGGGNTYSTRVAGTATLNADTIFLVTGQALFENGINFAGTATTFDKRGGGTVQLRGPANHTGSTLLQGGVLLLRGANGALTATSSIDLRNGELRIDNGDAVNPNRIPDTANVVLAGGALRVTGNETFGNFSAPVGNSQIVFNQASETVVGALTLNGFNRSFGATVQFQGPDFGPAYGATTLGQARISSRILIPGQTDVGGNAVIPGLFGNNGLDFIQYDGTTLDGGVPLGVRDIRNPGTTISSPTPYQDNLAETAWTDSVILRNTTAKALTDNRALEALKFEGAVTIALAGFNLRIETGGIIGATANATFTTTGGSVTAGPAVPGVNPVELFFTGNNTMLFDPAITNNGTQPVALVKSGTNTLSLRSTSATNTFTGGIYVNGGTLDVWRGRLLGNNAITLSGGILNLNIPDLSSGINLPDLGQNISVVGNAILSLDNNGETAGTGTNNRANFGTLAITGPYTFTARGFDGYDMSFNGITMTGRPTIDLIQGNTGGNGTNVILGGVLAGSGFNVVSTGNTATSAAVLVIGNGVGDLAPNTYNGKLVLVGGGFSGNQNAPVVQLNKAPGTNAITGEVEIDGGVLQLAADNQMPDTTDIVLNGGSMDFNGRNETVTKVTKRGGVFRTNPAGTAPVNTVVVTGDFISTGTGNFGTTEDVQVGTNSTLQINGLFKLDGFSRAVLGPSVATLVLNGGLELTGTLITQSGGAGLNIIRLLSNVQTFAAPAPSNLGNSTDSDTFLELDGMRTFTVADGPAGMDFQVSSVIRNNTSPVNVGGIIKTGPGTMQLQGGGTANSYTGATTINEGALVLFKTAGVNAISSTLVTVGDGNGGARVDRLVVRNSNQINDSADVTVSDSGLLDLGSFNASESIASLSGAGAVDLGPGSTLTIAGLTNTVFTGAVRGGGGINKTGASLLELSGTNEYIGPTLVSAGTLRITGSISGSAVTVSGGSIEGNGSINGPLTANGSGAVAPGLGGTTTAQLDTGNLNLDIGSTTTFDLNGNIAVSLFDQLNVTGSVTLAGNLAVTLGYVNVATDNLAVILNDGSDPVLGTFAGFPEGSTVATFGAVNIFITYQGNADGGPIANDVLLTVPEPGSAALLASALGVLGLRRRRS